MNIKQIQMFLALFKHRNLSDASKELGITQSAISMGLKELQNELSEQLFDRVGKRLIPNSSAELFYLRASEIEKLWSETKTLFLKEQIAGLLKVGVSQTVGTYLMPPIVYDFKKSFERVDIELFTSNTNRVLKRLSQGLLDLCFVEGEVDEKFYCVEKIAEDELVVVTARKEFAQREFFIDELYEYRWILREEGSGTRDCFEKNLGEYFGSLKVYMVLPSNEAIKTVLLEKDSFSCLSRYAIQEELRNQKLYEVKIKNISLKRQFSKVQLRNQGETRLLREFEEFVNQRVKQ